MTRPAYLMVDFDRCQACQRCLAADTCKLRVIVKRDPDEPPFLEAARCRDCLAYRKRAIPIAWGF